MAFWKKPPVKFNTSSSGRRVKLPDEKEDPLLPMKRAFRGHELFEKHLDEDDEEHILNEIGFAQKTGLIHQPDTTAPPNRRQAAGAALPPRQAAAPQETLLEAFADLPDRVALILFDHKYLRYVAGGLEDLCEEFSTYEDLVEYLQLQCGLEIDFAIHGTGPHPSGRACSFDLPLRFMTREVQNAQQEQKVMMPAEEEEFDESDASDSEIIAHFDRLATQPGRAHKELDELFAAVTEDELIAVIEDYVTIVVKVEFNTHVFTVSQWKVEFSS